LELGDLRAESGDLFVLGLSISELPRRFLELTFEIDLLWSRKRKTVNARYSFLLQAEEKENKPSP
jgi:hypothetical protein